MARWFQLQAWFPRLLLGKPNTTYQNIILDVFSVVSRKSIWVILACVSWQCHMEQDLAIGSPLRCTLWPRWSPVEWPLLRLRLGSQTPLERNLHFNGAASSGSCTGTSKLNHLSFAKEECVRGLSSHFSSYTTCSFSAAATGLKWKLPGRRLIVAHLMSSSWESIYRGIIIFLEITQQLL